jgi:hypothetical protein
MRANVSGAEKKAVAQNIIKTLNETEAKPRQQIRAIVDQCGIEFAQALLQETLQIEANGGMMLSDNSRRRTIGGVFFHLARQKMPREIVKAIFPQFARQKPTKGKAQPQPIVPVLPAFKWQDRNDILKPLLDEQGVLSTVKVTLIGRPGQINTSRKDLVITTMSHIAKSPTLPKGVPPPPDKPTLYTVYISAKQWNKVEEAITNPDDALIIEGTCAYDDEIGSIAVFTSNVTTKLTEAKKRQQKEGTAGIEQKNAESPAPTKVAPPLPKPAAIPPPVPAPTLPNAPLDVNQKLSELYASASLFRQKIANIQAKPAGQQFGLEMTQKLLKNVENEIAALEKKYTE